MENYNTDIYTKITQSVRLIINSDIHSGQNMTEAYYLSKAAEYGKAFYEMDNSGSRKRLSIWKREFGKGYEQIWKDIFPEVSDFILKTLEKAKKRKLIKDINAMSAQAVISEAMGKAGLKFHLTAQAYRAKIEVKVSEKCKALFYIKYKLINEEIGHVVATATSLRALIASMGEGGSIYEIRKWERWD